MIKYEKKSLFNVKYGIIAHGCNAQGVWGSGIAKDFKELYEVSYLEYKVFCNTKRTITGTAGFSKNFNELNQVAWLITSENYGEKVDAKATILANTALAVKDLCEEIIHWKKISTMDFKPDKKITIYSNKFNSGLFKVPWEETEEVLETVLKHFPNIEWIVCVPDLKS